MSDTDDKKNSGTAGDQTESTDPIIGEAVGSRLKTLFAEFSGEDVPDRFLDLIGQLEEKEQADKNGNSPTSDRDTEY